MFFNLGLMALEQTHISGAKNTRVWIGVYYPYNLCVAFLFTYIYHKIYLHWWLIFMVNVDREILYAIYMDPMVEEHWFLSAKTKAL